MLNAILYTEMDVVFTFLITNYLAEVKLVGQEVGVYWCSFSKHWTGWEVYGVRLGGVSTVSATGLLFVIMRSCLPSQYWWRRGTVFTNVVFVLITLNGWGGSVCVGVLRIRNTELNEGDVRAHDIEHQGEGWNCLQEWPFSDVRLHNSVMSVGTGGVYQGGSHGQNIELGETCGVN